MVLAWGEAASGDLIIDPGMWSIDNFLIKLFVIVDGECFEWNSAATNAADSRATIITNAPTASDMLVSTPDDIVFFGTETTIGDKTTQDICLLDSQTRDVNTYTATNTAGTQGTATDHGSWERLEVEMRSMFTQIQLCSYKDS